MTGNTDDVRALTRETQEIWDQKAEYWDERMGEGDAAAHPAGELVRIGVGEFAQADQGQFLARAVEARHGPIRVIIRSA